jgi:hypothetical protein
MQDQRDGVLFEKLQSIVERFVTIERLREVAHGMDTQVNESFNNTFSWLAPKNKIYCGTQSLRNRLSIGIGINALGLVEYFTRRYKSLGIIMTPNVTHFLEMKEDKRSKRHQKVKLIESKKARRAVRFEKQRKDEATANKERAKRDGTYKPGQNLEDVTEDNVQDKKPAAVSTANRICPHCKKKGHTTTRSKKCTYYGQTALPTSAAENATTMAASVPQPVDAEAEEIDEMHCRPIRIDPPSDEDNSFAEFQDCNTWDENEEPIAQQQEGVIVLKTAIIYS